MRYIKPPLRYGYANLVSYAFNIVDDIKSQEPQPNREAITNTEYV